ncbi:hypothetical protein L596_003574 [Steinernema carpocapsae]|uniref:Mitochondrial import receptor subunit TOM70 n=1 Tax=Steinernema carpocapsae TaxID=34508 RepID=A0A4U8UT48_STECR|nr:hypothetical protein L596_003574 [Steinernema carpocapsae]
MDVNNISSGTSWGTVSKAVGVASAIGIGGGIGYYLYKKHTAEGAKEECDPETLKAQGNALFKEKKYEEALAKFQKAIAFNEKSNNLKAVCYQNMGAVYEYMGDLKLCVAACSKAIEVDVRYSKAYIRRAKAYKALKCVDESLQDEMMCSYLLKDQKYVSIDHIVFKTMEAFNHKLDLYTNRRVPISPTTIDIWALYTFTEDPVVGLMKRASPDDEHERLFAECYEKIKAHEVNSLLDMVLPETENSSSPLYFHVLLFAARLYNYHGDLQKSEEYLKKFDEEISDGESTLSEETKRAIIVSALLLRVVNSVDPADQAEFLRKAKETDTNNCDIYMTEGLSAMDMHDFRKVAESFAKAFEKNPDHQPARAHLVFSQAMLALMNNDMSAVNTSIMTLDKMAGDLTDTYPYINILAGRLYLSCGAVKEAEKFLAVAKAKMPHLGLAHFMHALASSEEDTSLNMDDVAKSAKVLNKIIEIDQFFAPPYTLLSKVYLKHEQYDLAMDALNQALMVSSTHQDYGSAFVDRLVLQQSFNIANNLNIPRKDVVGFLVLQCQWLK